MRVLLAALVVLLLGCGARVDSESNASLSDIENVSGLDSEANNPVRVPVPAPTLEPLERAEIERELAPGAGCELSQDGRLLLVAVAGDAIAKPDGRIVHLQAEGALAPTGGFFASEAVRISIGRVSDAGHRVDETTAWPARAAISSRQSDKPAEIEAVWTCGA